MGIDMITQSELKSLIIYNPESGDFIWKEMVGKQFKSFNSTFKGKEAGCIFKNGKGKKYLTIRINKVLYLAHRLAFLYMNGEMPIEVDHEDGNGLNNAWLNLRDVDRIENSRNHKRRSTNKTGVTGVSLRSDTGKYTSRITIKGKDVRLGCYSDFFEACCARKSAESKYGFHKNHDQDRPL